MTNGDHAEARRRRNTKQANKRTRAQRAPLRLVMERRLVDGQLVETLECGHDQAPRAALFGGVAPDRRRCVPCLDELEAAVERGEA